MKRRYFLNTGITLAYSGWMARREFAIKRPVKPRPLQEGDVVGLVTPGFPAGEEAFEKAVENIRNLGLVPRYSKKVNGHYGYLAGTDADRAK